MGWLKFWAILIGELVLGSGYDGFWDNVAIITSIVKRGKSYST